MVETPLFLIMNETLIICPTRIRPDRIQEMLASYKDTSRNSDIVFYVANDDPRLEEYHKVLQGLNWFIGRRIPIAQIFNYFAQSYHRYKYYGIINDDHIFITQDWDKLLIEKLQETGKFLAYANDLSVQNDNYRLVGACIVAAEAVNRLGYLINPVFEHLYIDNWQLELFTEANKLIYCPDIIIEHKHFLNGKAPLDDNYNGLYFKEKLEFERKKMDFWRTHLRIKELEKLNDHSNI